MSYTHNQSDMVYARARRGLALARALWVGSIFVAIPRIPAAATTVDPLFAAALLVFLAGSVVFIIDIRTVETAGKVARRGGQ